MDHFIREVTEPVPCVHSVCTKPCLMCPMKAFVNAVKKNVDEMEESVSTAERELGSHKIQKVLKSIPGLRQVSLKLNVFNDICKHSPSVFISRSPRARLRLPFARWA